ncbi:MAG: electron transfer flavoprotein subunit alpha/FixB family protein [Chloroflexota bacterium]
MANEQGVMIIAETATGALSSVSAELSAIGRRLADELGEPLCALLMGESVAGLATQLGELGADRVLVADHELLGMYQPDLARAAALAAIQAANPAVLLLGQTVNGRDLAPRLAFRLGTGLVTDCTDLHIDPASRLMVMTKPVYGGSALAEYTVTDARPQIATVRPRVFVPAEPQPGRPTDIVHIQPDLASVPSRIRNGETVQAEAATGPRLKDAKTVVSGGRGLGGAENWPVIEEIAGLLGAAVGASRAVTDAGWVPPAHQVGLTGQTIAPDLYITVGISGAVQHIAGCSGSRNIVAINKDADANIFKVARYGVVGDYKQVLPAFTKRVRELMG